MVGKTLGRPRTDKEKRKGFTCMLKPANIKAIDSWAGSRGINLDRLIEKELKELG